MLSVITSQELTVCLEFFFHPIPIYLIHTEPQKPLQGMEGEVKIFACW